MGGLSEIDCSAKSGTWIMQSDDRSDINPAHFYSAMLDYDAQSFPSATLTAVIPFKQENGTTYPNRPQCNLRRRGFRYRSVRFDSDGSIWYRSEGDRSLGLDPFVKHATFNGYYIARLPLPANFKMLSMTETGSCNNLTFEGLTFAPDGKSLGVSMEAPVFEGGPVPTTANGAYSRITQYDRTDKMLRIVTSATVIYRR